MPLTWSKTVSIQDYPLKDHAYHSAIAAARKEIADGFAISYLTGYNRDQGRYIDIQTDQGWNPVSFWQEYQPDYSPKIED